MLFAAEEKGAIRPAAFTLKKLLFRAIEK